MPVLTRTLRTLVRAAALAIVLASLLAPRSAPHAQGASPFSCPQADPKPLGALPQTRGALDAGLPIIVVALGSSSTQGWMSSDAAHTYPAVLQQVLNEGVPKGHFAIINRGIGGEDAPEELARMQADVLVIRPQLVIWQVGANGAMRNDDPSIFRNKLLDGVQRLLASGADVILMDNQRSPAVLQSAGNDQIVRTMAEVAASTGASLFSRTALMDAWRAEGAPYSQFIASDGVHQNDRGYHCVAEALAASIEAALEKRIVTSSR